MSDTERLLGNAEEYAASRGPLEAERKPSVAIITCMDARIDVFRLFGLEPGDAHVIRNAGGLVTDDVLRSLVISQRLLGTREIIVMAHTDCGMQKFDDEELASQVRASAGVRPPFEFLAFPDLDESVRGGVKTLRASQWLMERQVRGFVFNVEEGSLREVPVP